MSWDAGSSIVYKGSCFTPPRPPSSLAFDYFHPKWTSSNNQYPTGSWLWHHHSPPSDWLSCYSPCSLTFLKIPRSCRVSPLLDQLHVNFCLIYIYTPYFSILFLPIPHPILLNLPFSSSFTSCLHEVVVAHHVATGRWPHPCAFSTAPSHPSSSLCTQQRCPAT